MPLLLLVYNEKFQKIYYLFKMHGPYSLPSKKVDQGEITNVVDVNTFDLNISYKKSILGIEI